MRKPDNLFPRASQQKTSRLNIWQSTWPTFFISFTSVFSYLCSKHPHTAHMCGGFRGVTWVGKGGTVPRVPNHYGGVESFRREPNKCRGRQKVPKMSQVLSPIQYICFRNTSDSNMGAPNSLLAPSAISPRYAPGWHKDVKPQREEQLATRWTRLQNLTHRSKTPQVKRTQMVATARFDSRVCYFFSLLRIERRAKGCEV